MKPVVSDYRYRVLCVRIVPIVGSPIYLTDHPRDIIMSGHTYLSTAGYQFTGVSATDGFSPSAIDLEGIAVSSGSACSSGKVAKSHVLAAMGIKPEISQAAIRVSLGWDTAEDNIDHFIAAWRKIRDRHKARAAA